MAVRHGWFGGAMKLAFNQGNKFPRLIKDYARMDQIRDDDVKYELDFSHWEFMTIIIHAVYTCLG